MDKRVLQRVKGLKDAIRKIKPDWDGLLPKSLLGGPYIDCLVKYLHRLQARAMLDLAILELGEEDNKFIEMLGAMPKPPNYGIPSHLIIDEEISPNETKQDSRQADKMEG